MLSDVIGISFLVIFAGWVIFDLMAKRDDADDVLDNDLDDDAVNKFGHSVNNNNDKRNNVDKDLEDEFLERKSDLEDIVADDEQSEEVREQADDEYNDVCDEHDDVFGK